jgi:sulfotransferase 6B1
MEFFILTLVTLINCLGGIMYARFNNFVPVLILFVCLPITPASIYVNSIPKCGTHLLTRCLELMTGLKKHNLVGDYVTKDKLPIIPEDEFYYFHVQYSDAAAKVFEKYAMRCFFIYRDPRDEVISYAYWRFVRYNWKDRMNFPQLINTLIDEVPKRYKAFLSWRKHPLYHSLRFEDLIGPLGGGQEKAQRKAIRKIANHIGIKLKKKKVTAIAENLFGHGGGTFREGKIGSWKEHFTEAMKQRFKEKANDILIELGYETDANW